MTCCIPGTLQKKHHKNHSWATELETPFAASNKQTNIRERKSFPGPFVLRMLKALWESCLGKLMFLSCLGQGINLTKSWSPERWAPIKRVQFADHFMCLLLLGRLSLCGGCTEGTQQPSINSSADTKGQFYFSAVVPNPSLILPPDELLTSA